MRRLARWTLVLTVLAGSYVAVHASVAANWTRLTTRDVPVVVRRSEKPLPKFDHAWVRWFEVVMREPRSARWSVVRTWESAEVDLGGEVREVAVQQIRLTGRNGFGGRSESEAWVAVPGPWFRLDDGPWLPLAAWH